MLELDKDQLASLYMQGNAAVRKSLREMLGERLNEEIPVTSRVRTFNDAIEELGEAHEAVKAYRDIEWKLGKEHKDLLAYLKLRIITEALNEGWKPQFTEGERRWYACMNFLQKKKWTLCPTRKRKNAVLSVVRAATRVRMAVSGMRTRTTFLRTRTRATALGSPSNLRNWPNMQASSSQKFTQTTVSFLKRRQKHNPTYMWERTENVHSHIKPQEWNEHKFKTEPAETAARRVEEKHTVAPSTR